MSLSISPPSWHWVDIGWVFGLDGRSRHRAWLHFVHCHRHKNVLEGWQPRVSLGQSNKLTLGGWYPLDVGWILILEVYGIDPADDICPLSPPQQCSKDDNHMWACASVQSDTRVTVTPTRPTHLSCSQIQQHCSSNKNNINNSKNKNNHCYFLCVCGLAQVETFQSVLNLCLNCSVH